MDELSLKTPTSPSFAGSLYPPTPPSTNGAIKGTPSSRATNGIHKSQNSSGSSNGPAHVCEPFSKFILFPKLPLELRLIIWRYSIPRHIRQPSLPNRSSQLLHSTGQARQADRLRHKNGGLRKKLNLIGHTLDIPYFNLLDMTVATNIRKAIREFMAWMHTTDTIALSINMNHYMQLLSIRVSRRQMIGNAIIAVLKVLPFNIRDLLIILDYNEGGESAYLGDVDHASEPQFQYIQDEVSRMVSAAYSKRFVVAYKAVKARKSLKAQDSCE